MANRPVVKAVMAVVGVAALFSACSFVTWRQLGPLTAAADSGNAGAHALILAFNFWARYALFLTIAAVFGIFSIRRFIERVR
jgi:hypothetical protein